MSKFKKKNSWRVSTANSMEQKIVSANSISAHSKSPSQSNEHKQKELEK